VVQVPDKIAPSGFARDGRLQRGIQDHLGLLERRQVIKVAQELKELTFRTLFSGSINQWC
jgi:hypothetical protein